MMAKSDFARDLALIGTGYWGRNLARNFLSLGALHTLCDLQPTALDSLGAEYSEIKRTSDVEKVLADKTIKCVAIAAPAVTHYELALAALKAGKDVFVEKPLCLEQSEGAELVEYAESHARILMVGHLLQYHPCVRQLEALLAQGELGKLYYITSNRLNLGRIRQEENALWSFAPHDISVILSLAGNRLPQQVRCTGEAYLSSGVADTSLTTLKFFDGVRAHIYVSWLNPFKEQKLTVVGSHGMAVFDDTKPWAQKLVMHRKYLTWTNGRTPTPSTSDGEPIPTEPAEPLRLECAHFLECCQDRRPARTDGREGLRVLRVLQAAQASLEKGGELEAAVPSAAGARGNVHASAVVDPGARIGRGTRVWHFTHIMAGAEIGENCNLGQNVVVSPGVKLGCNVKVQNNVSIYTGAVIEDDVFLGPSCVLTNVSNPRSQVKRQSIYEPTLVRRGATVGANATIVCGVTLGRYCFVAAGAVVTKSVPDYGFVAGLPARQQGWISRHGHRLKQGPDGLMRCPESGYRYREVEPGIVRCLDLDEEAPLPADLAVGRTSYRAIRESAGRI